jgi:hypothetical protein
MDIGNSTNFAEGEDIFGRVSPQLVRIVWLIAMKFCISWDSNWHFRILRITFSRKNRCAQADWSASSGLSFPFWTVHGEGEWQSQGHSAISAAFNNCVSEDMLVGLQGSCILFCILHPWSWPWSLSWTSDITDDYSAVPALLFSCTSPTFQLYWNTITYSRLPFSWRLQELSSVGFHSGLSLIYITPGNTLIYCT